ncbi:MAG: DUF4384 domain-containing protein, partial [Caulobacterales bacterium]|nr:DUF4384 domain-containing protein [Caulobacterales bacterium]
PTEQLKLQLFLAGAAAPGAPVRVDLAANANAFAYCYLEDVNGTVARVFPNRWQPNALVPPGEKVSVPSEEAGFSLVAPDAGAQERLICFGSDREVIVGLPAELRTDDLSPLPIRGLHELRKLFQDEAVRQAGQLTITEQTLSARGG